MYEQANQVAIDAVGSIRTIASFCAEEKVMDMYQKKCDGPMKSGIRLGIVSGASLGVGSSVLFLVNSFIFYIGSVLEKHGKATFAEIFRVFFTMTAIGVSMTIGMAQDIDKVKNSAASIFQILDSKPKIDSSNEEGSTIDTLKGDIGLCNVSFKYPTRTNIPIFIDLCLSIPSGKTLALVGESGSGKSTVITLIESFRYSLTLDSIWVWLLEILVGIFGQFKLQSVERDGEIALLSTQKRPYSNNKGFFKSTGARGCIFPGTNARCRSYPCSRKCLNDMSLHPIVRHEAAEALGAFGLRIDPAAPSSGSSVHQLRNSQSSASNTYWSNC
ncbi:ABC transporter B family member 11-like [Heracleum sosnowskyi]|uniref:ABC transporter B family member 11-like n=1 Tax=Heracleum sosnowskyi TaxID=360622 RepID=A0AAD8MB29_9APIA|nr:ABC transporter B family member 11-like [Heracleum sosnowskyi]